MYCKAEIRTKSGGWMWISGSMLLCEAPPCHATAMVPLIDGFQKTSQTFQRYGLKLLYSCNAMPLLSKVSV